MLTQAPLVLPSSFIFSPAAKPEGYSSMPMCSSAPSSLLTSRPESIEITGMPAATAARIESPSASASGIETTSPSGCEATAASISCAIATMSKVCGAWYWTSTPISSAASSTPFLTTDQNASDAWPWVITTILVACAGALAATATPRGQSDASESLA